MKISAIILSAGSSHRMGKPKALLRIRSKTFLQHILDIVVSAGIQESIIVLGHDAQTIQETLSSFNGRIIVNKQWALGQLSSIIAGINVVNEKDTKGVLICPVDHPLISTALIQKLIHSFLSADKTIVIPTFKERRGHPIIISSELFDEIKNASLHIGLREVIRAHSNDICEVPADEEGILFNIDTQEDFQKYIDN